MREMTTSPLFGVLISLIAFQIACFISAKTKFALFNPLLLSILFIIAFLMNFNISFEDYKIGGEFISFFLGPSTVILAVPLYKKMDLLKKHCVPILVGIFSGCLAAITSIAILNYLFKLDTSIGLSLIPKSVTTPIGVEISSQLGGIPSLTVAAITITGITGSVIGPTVLKILRIKNKIAIGAAIGTASHAVGTSKAVELGETEGAISGLSIGLAGLITVFLTPAILHIFIMLVQ